MSTEQELNAELIKTAAVYNSTAGAGETDEETAARAAAADLEQNQGSRTHNGEFEVHADTEEEQAAAAEAAAKEEAEKAEADAAKKAEEEAKETPEEKAKREAEEEAAKHEGETEEEKAAREEAEAASKKEVEDAEWMTTDSKELNAALKIMKAAGMTPAEAADMFDEASVTGDLSKVDQAALVERIGEDNAALVMAGFTSYVETEGQAVLERVKKVHDTVGGTDNWSKMTQWARGKAKGDTEFRTKVEGITKMMNEGDALQAELATKEFLSMYNGDSKNSTLTTQTTSDVSVHKAKAAETKPTVTPLSARQYAEAVETATRTLRGADQNAAIAEARRGRAAGRSAGL